MVKSNGIQEVYVGVSHQPGRKPNAVADEQNIQSYVWPRHSRSEQIRKQNADHGLLSAAYDVTQKSRSQYLYDQSSVLSLGGISGLAALMSGYKTDDGKHKRDSQYHNDHFRSSTSARGVSHYVTPLSKHKMDDVKQKRNIYDQFKASSIGEMSRYRKPLSELEVGGNKQKSKSRNDRSKSSPSSGGKYGSHSATSQSNHEMKKQKKKDLHDQSWSSYIFEGICNLCNWSESKATQSKQESQYDHSRSSPSLHKAAGGKQRRDSRYDHSRSSPARRLYGYATPSSEHHTVGGYKQKSRSQHMHDQSRSSPSVGGISMCATPLSEHGMGGGKQKSKRYDRSISTKGISSCATPLSGYKANGGKQKQCNSSVTGRIPRYSTSSLADNSKQKSKGHCDQSSSVIRSSRYATPQSERQVGAAKHQRKSQNDRSRKSPSSGVKSGCGVTGQNMKLTSKGARTQNGRAN